VNFNNIFDKEYRPTFGELPGVRRSVEVSARVKF
jgi:outer membrane receptor for ferric coprogen and ferric-rhodotorulic acid